MSLPTGWTEAAITDIVTVNPANPDTVPPDDTLVSFVPMALVEELTGQPDASRHRPWREVKKGFSKFQEGDVVVANRSAVRTPEPGFVTQCPEALLASNTCRRCGHESLLPSRCGRSRRPESDNARDLHHLAAI